MHAQIDSSSSSISVSAVAHAAAPGITHQAAAPRKKHDSTAHFDIYAAYTSFHYVLL